MPNIDKHKEIDLITEINFTNYQFLLIFIFLIMKKLKTLLSLAATLTFTLAVSFVWGCN